MSYFIDLVIVGISLGMIYGLVAIGISLIYSGLDVVHFAHGEIYMFGAYIGLMIYNTFHLPLPLVRMHKRRAIQPDSDLRGESSRHRSRNGFCIRKQRSGAVCYETAR